ncbi:MAG: CerR family C-terminal domain-containing protein [Kiritimatiellae bacterium]|nr:CerR family C-terminal domain-containing protein [Kiritimatiellia bacterium]
MADVSHEQTRERILHAAAELFAGGGLHGTGIRAICEKAGTNSASVNYYFHSKENLYIEVFRSLFDGFKQVFLSIPDKIHDAASWRAALTEWVEYSLRTSTSNNPRDRWIIQLVAHERTDPTSAMPLLQKKFFDPLKASIRRIVCMGMPADCTEFDVHLVTISLLAQCAIYHHRKPPWGKLLIPPDVDHETWIARTTQFIVEGITCRLSFRTTNV